MTTKPKTVGEWMSANGRKPHADCWRSANRPDGYDRSPHLLPHHIFANLREYSGSGVASYETDAEAIGDLEQALIATGEIERSAYQVGDKVTTPNGDVLTCVGPEVVVNAAGGKQSAIPTRFDLMPPDALTQVAEVLHRGSHYGVDNWRLIPKRDHINHAMLHIVKHLQGDTSETHLANAACRILFAIEAPNEVPNG